jgi:hypothetical protein
MMATRRTSVLRMSMAAGAVVVLGVLGALGGCSSSGDAGGTNDDSASGAAPAATREQADSGGAAAPALSTNDGDQAAAGDVSNPGVEQQQVISTGNVQLRSDDVGQAIFDVRKVVDTYGGTVSEDDTETDKDGAALRSRMVLRIPTAGFDDAMTGLEGIGTLVSSKRQSADVTTQVLDTEVRVEAQQRSIDRIQVLFDHATSIKDIVSIETELSRRQADLASLQAQQRYLADQTSMSTITVAVERTAKAAPKPKAESDDAGFVSGLAGGWGALRTFLVAAATVAGALLPWLALVLVLAVPGWPLYRRLRRRTAPGAPVAPA